MKEVMLQVVKFVINNRRIIGLIVGSTLTLAGYQDAGNYVIKAGDIE